MRNLGRHCLVDALKRTERAADGANSLLPRAVLLFHTLPPVAAALASVRQSAEPFCIVCFRSSLRCSESAGLAADTDAAHTARALLCWMLLTQPLPAPRGLPCCNLRLWAYSCFLTSRAFAAFLFHGTRYKSGVSVRSCQPGHVALRAARSAFTIAWGCDCGRAQHQALRRQKQR